MDSRHAPHEVRSLLINSCTSLSPCLVRSLLVRKQLVDVVLDIRCHSSLCLFLHDLFQGVVLNLFCEIAVLEVIVVHTDSSFHRRYEVFWWTLFKRFCLLIVEGCVPQFLVIMTELLSYLFGVDQGLTFL